MKKLAVLMPTYNCAQYLQESIDSILNQTYSDFDFYVYDDCSTDATSQIISNYTDKRIFYIKNAENRGIAKTLNLGLETLLPHYEYIARMDADDWSFPERFEKQLDFMDKNTEIVMSGTQGYWLKNIGQYPVSAWEYSINNEYIKVALLFSASFGHSSVVFRSAFFKHNNLRYSQEIKTCEDWDLWTRVSQLGKIANLSQFLMKYRIVSTSNHRAPEKIKTHLEERSLIISNYWQSFNIEMSPAQVYEYYYDTENNMRQHFYSKLETLIDSFNALFLKHGNNLEDRERKQFGYMLARRIADFWKRSGVARYNPSVWWMILAKVKFINIIKLIKSQLK